MTSRRQFLNSSIVASVGYHLSPSVLLAQEIRLIDRDKFVGDINIIASKPLDSEAIRKKQGQAFYVFGTNEKTVNDLRAMDASFRLLATAQAAEKLPPDQRLEKLKEARNIFDSNGGVTSEQSVYNGPKSIYDSLDELESKQFLQDISIASGKAAATLAASGAVVAGVGLVVPPVAPVAEPGAVLLELSAAGATLVSALTSQNSEVDARTDKLAHVMQVYAKKSIRHIYAKPNMAEGINFISKEYGIDTSFLKTDISLDNLPSNLRPAFEHLTGLVQKGKGFSAEEQVKQADKLKTDLADHFEKAIAGYLASEEARRAKENQDEIKSLIQKRDKEIIDSRDAREIESAAYLTSFIASHVFKDPKVANGVTQTYKCFSLVANTLKDWDTKTSKGIRAISAITLTGNFVQAFSMLASIFTGGGEDPTLAALRSIQKALNVVRREMHKRFDEVMKTQLRILEKLAKVEGRVEALHATLAEIKAMVTINDNEARLRDAEEYKAKLKEAVNALKAEIKLQRVSGESEAMVLKYASLLFVHADETSAYNAFTRNDAGKMTAVARGWDARHIRTVFRDGSTNLFYLLGYIPTVRNHVRLPMETEWPFRNIDVFVEGSNLFSQAYAGLPHFRKKHLDSIAADFKKVGREIELTYREALDDRFIFVLREKIIESFTAYIQELLRGALILLRKVERKGTISENAVIYPFAHPMSHSIKNGGAVPEPFYHGRRISWWQKGNKKVEAHVDFSAKQVAQMQKNDSATRLGERVSMSRISFDTALNYALMDVQLVEAEKKVDDDRFYRSTFHMNIVSGDYSGTVIPHVRYYQKTDNLNYRDCCLDIRLNTLKLGSRSFQGEQIDDAHPEVQASDYKAYERFLYELIGIQHDKLRGEYVSEFRAAFDHDNNVKSDAKANFESLVSILCYLAGLSQQLGGQSPEDCARFAKTAHECLLADRDSLEYAVRDLLLPANAPRDKEGKLLEAVDVNIIDYLAAKLKARLAKNLDMFAKEHIHSRDKGIELMEFRAALGRIEALSKLNDHE